MKKFMTGLFIFCLFISAVQAKTEKIRIAVLEFQANNVSKFASKAISEIISTEMAKTDDFIVIERSQMGNILDEQGFQQTGCTDSACAVQLGKLLSARKILIGTISKLGSLYNITAKVIDVETARVDYGEFENCTKEEELEPAGRILAVKLINRITGKSYSLPQRSYKTEEERRRFFTNASFRYGFINGLNYPVVQVYSSSGAAFVAKKINATELYCIISPGYEISSNFSLIADLKYTAIKSTTDVEKDTYNSGSNAGTSQWYYQSDLFKGYGSTLKGQYNFRFDGFIPFISLGIGYMYYKRVEFLLENSNDNLLVSNNTTGGRAFYKVDADKKVNVFTVDIAVGVTIYISKYMDLVLSGGADIPILAKAYRNPSAKYTRTWGTGPFPASTVIDDNFKGNFPPAYFIQAGAAFKLF